MRDWLGRYKFSPSTGWTVLRVVTVFLVGDVIAAAAYGQHTWGLVTFLFLLLDVVFLRMLRDNTVAAAPPSGTSRHLGNNTARPIPPRIKARLQYEDKVVFWRQHPTALFFEIRGGAFDIEDAPTSLAKLAKRAVVTLVVLIIAAIAAYFLKWWLVPIIIAAFCIRAAWRYSGRKVTWYALTEQRMLMTRGIISQSGPEVRLEKFVDREPKVPWHSRLLYALGLIWAKYGSLESETAGPNRNARPLEKMPYVPSVMEVYTYVTAFQNRKGAPHDGE